MTLPHGRYSFTVTINDPVLEQPILVDFDCEVDIDTEIHAGVPECTCTEVYVDGKPLRDGSELSKMVRLSVMMAAEDDIRDAGTLWDKVREAEGLSYQGLGGNDPDGAWIHA